jgi:membrane-associated protein
VVLLTYAGYLFGNMPVIKDNLTLVIVGIVLLSISPGIIEVLRQRAAARTAQGQRPD